jgi:hydroxymethylpyrimidine pyrophosphatase-like HAD family hydrolase
LRLFIDIDGTLTDTPESSWGNPNEEIINKVKKWIDKGVNVVIWSSRGEKYSRQFCKKYDIINVICIGKPDLIVDNNPTIRPKHKMHILTPNQFLKLEL